MEGPVDSFECQCAERFRSACEKLPHYGEREGKQYCVLHLPSEDKADDFKEALETKLGNNDFGFGGTFFPSGTAQFENFEFRSRANFSEVTFCGVANFRGAQFSGERSDFRGAQFTAAETSFEGTTLGREVSFERTTFKEKVVLLGTENNAVFGSQSWVRFDHSRIHRPELLTFNTVTLHPGWFVNVDVRKVDFTDVRWYRLPGDPRDFKHAVEALKGRIRDAAEALKKQMNGKEGKSEPDQKPEAEEDQGHRSYPERLRSYKKRLALAWQKLTATALDYEIEVLRARNVESPYTQLRIACQRLAANAEENRVHSHASGFNYWAMDAQRKEKWVSAFAPWRLIW